MDHITGADVLQYGALGLCFAIITTASYLLRYGIKLGAGAASNLGSGLMEFATSQKLLADKLDALGSAQRHSEDTNVANKTKLAEHDERAKSIHAKVVEIDGKLERIDEKVASLQCVRAKTDTGKQ
jgi:hypothetical protein